jgi:hypothetical protein
MIYGNNEENPDPKSFNKTVRIHNLGLTLGLVATSWGEAMTALLMEMSLPGDTASTGYRTPSSVYNSLLQLELG